MNIQIKVNEAGKGTCMIDGHPIEHRLVRFEVRSDVNNPPTEVTLHLIATEVDLDIDTSGANISTETTG